MFYKYVIILAINRQNLKAIMKTMRFILQHMLKPNMAKKFHKMNVAIKENCAEMCTSSIKLTNKL